MCSGSINCGGAEASTVVRRKHRTVVGPDPVAQEAHKMDQVDMGFATVFGSFDVTTGILL